jgi:hypothetical protein
MKKTNDYRKKIARGLGLTTFIGAAEYIKKTAWDGEYILVQDGPIQVFGAVVAGVVGLAVTYGGEWLIDQWDEFMAERKAEESDTEEPVGEAEA